MTRLLARPAPLAAALALLVLGAGIVKYGIGVFPSWVYLYDIAANADDPSQAPLMEPPADYLLANFPGPWLAGQLGLTGRLPYLAFHLALTALAVLLPFAMPAVRKSPARARTLAAVLAGSAVLAVLLGWVGGYDAVSVIAMVVATLARNPAVMALGWLLLGLNHPTLGIVALALWIPIAMTRRPVRRSAILAAVGGLALGIAANLAIVGSWGGATSRWQLLAEVASAESVATLARTWPLVLFGAFGVGWVVLLAPGVRSSLGSRILLVEGVVAATVLPLVLVDATRVVALALLPALLAWVVSSADAARFGGRRRIAQTVLIAAVIVPVPVVWNAVPAVGSWASLTTLDSAWQPPEGYSLR